MPLIDISLPLQPGMLLYPGDEAPELRRLASIGAGDLLTASELRIGCHVGTHVDAPAHFLEGGATLEAMPLNRFCGPAFVMEFPALDAIGEQHLLPQGMPRSHHLLLKTRNSRMLLEPRFREDYCIVTPEAMEALLEREPRSIGFDYYSLDPYSSTEFPAHLAAAQQGVPVFVCLNLAAVTPGYYWFCAAPVAVAGAEGMPVRAVLCAARQEPEA